MSTSEEELKIEEELEDASVENGRSVSPEPTMKVEDNVMSENKDDNEDDDVSLDDSERARSRSHFSNAGRTEDQAKKENRPELVTEFLKAITSSNVRGVFSDLLDHLTDDNFFNMYYSKGTVSSAKHPLALIRSRIISALQSQWDDREFTSAITKIGSYDAFKVLQQAQSFAHNHDNPSEYIKEKVKDVAFPKRKRLESKRKLDPTENALIKKIRHDHTDFNASLDTFLDTHYGDSACKERTEAEDRLKRLPEAKAFEVLRVELDGSDDEKQIAEAFTKAFTTSKPTLLQQVKWFCWDHHLDDDTLERILSLPRTGTMEVVRSHFTSPQQLRALLRRMEPKKIESVHSQLSTYASKNDFSENAMELIKLVDCCTATRILSQKMTSDEVENLFTQATIYIDEDTKWSDIGITFQADSLQIRAIVPGSLASDTPLQRHMTLAALNKRFLSNCDDLNKAFNNATESIMLTVVGQ